MQICWRSTLMGTCPTTCVKTTQHWTSLRQLWPTEVEYKCLKRCHSCRCLAVDRICSSHLMRTIFCEQVWVLISLTMSADRLNKWDDVASLYAVFKSLVGVLHLLFSILCQVDKMHTLIILPLQAFIVLVQHVFVKPRVGQVSDRSRVTTCTV